MFVFPVVYPTTVTCWAFLKYVNTQTSIQKNWTKMEEYKCLENHEKNIEKKVLITSCFETLILY